MIFTLRINGWVFLEYDYFLYIILFFKENKNILWSQNKYRKQPKYKAIRIDHLNSNNNILVYIYQKLFETFNRIF